MGYQLNLLVFLFKQTLVVFTQKQQLITAISILEIVISFKDLQILYLTIAEVVALDSSCGNVILISIMLVLIFSLFQAQAALQFKSIFAILLILLDQQLHLQ